MICDICGEKSAVVRRVSRSYGKGRRLLVIENIPVVRCLRCRESNVSAQTLFEIERIRLHRGPFGRLRKVAVASFP